MGALTRIKPVTRWRCLSQSRALCAGLIIGASLVPGIAIGGEWTANFSSLMSTTYNNNPSLVTEDAKGRTDFTVNRAIDGEYAKDRYRIDVVGRANVVASKDEIAKSIFSADQIRYNLDVGGEYDFEASVVAAAFGLGFDTVQNTEFEDTGTLAGGATKTTMDFGLSYSRQLTERWSLDVSDDVSVVSFSGGSFTGSTNNSLGVALANAYSERLTITPSIGYSRFVPDSESSKTSNTYRIDLGGQYELSEIDGLGASLGILQTDGNLGWSAKVDYSQEFLEGLVTSASVNRDNIPSSSGNIRQSTGIGGGVTYQLTEMTQIGFNTNWRTSSQVGVTGAAVTTQLTMSPFLNWTISEEWRASLNMENRSQKQPTDGTATSRSATFALNYNLPLE